MTTKQILVEFAKLFEKWGLSLDDYCFGGEYGLRFLGWSIRPRKKHFDFYVDSKALPWKAIPGAESTTPPKSSKYFQDFQKFIRATNCDPHFLPMPLVDLNAENILTRSRIYDLDSDYKLRIIKPKEQIISYYRVIKNYDFRESWTEEKINRFLNYFIRFKKHAQKIHNKEILKWCNKGVKLAKKLGFQKHYNNLEDNVSAQKKLFGLPTFKGKVKGRIKVVFNSADLGKIRRANIMVARYAKTEYIKVFDKISAIVTDQGGTTSHAAILSREHRVPCIVGTKIATKVFKDGDLVEVDANKGVVRKI